MIFSIFTVRSGRRELAEQEEYWVLKVNTILFPEDAFIFKILGFSGCPAALLGCKCPDKHSDHPSLIT